MNAQLTEYLEITDAKYVGDYRISLRFNDGTERMMDFGPFLRQAGNPQTTAFRNIKKFKSFHLHHGDLMRGEYEMIFPIADLHRGEI